MDNYTQLISATVVFYKLHLTNVREIDEEKITENSLIEFLVPRI